MLHQESSQKKNTRICTAFNSQQCRVIATGLVILQQHKPISNAPGGHLHIDAREKLFLQEVKEIGIDTQSEYFISLSIITNLDKNAWSVPPNLDQPLMKNSRPYLPIDGPLYDAIQDYFASQTPEDLENKNWTDIVRQAVAALKREYSFDVKYAHLAMDRSQCHNTIQNGKWNTRNQIILAPTPGPPPPVESPAWQSQQPPTPCVTSQQQQSIVAESKKKISPDILRMLEESRKRESGFSDRFCGAADEMIATISEKAAAISEKAKHLDGQRKSEHTFQNCVLYGSPNSPMQQGR